MRGSKAIVLGIGLLLVGGVAAFAQVPAAPSNLQASAISDDAIVISWQDNSNNENEFRIEVRTPITGYVDIGSVPANFTSATITNLQPSTTYFFRVRARNFSGNSAYSNEAFATTLSQGGACVESPTAVCLNNGRFRVEATWRTPAGATGTAGAVRLTTESGYFWFFSQSNVEVVFKVLNGCSLNNRYWFFAAGLTNVEVVIRVTDTQTGATKTYTNPLNRPFPPIQDTSAFATCP